jgi:2-polyprenyl-3-methyl-5-hydroxy-6-metoxy-1,4-benzoquinol methylase
MSDYEWGERWDLDCALPARPESILDVGCGAGMDFLSLAKRGTEVVGVDSDPAAIAKASARLREVRLLEVGRDPWPSEWQGHFEVVAFCDSLEHMVDPWTVLRDVRPLLRTGGRVVASIPNLRQWRLVVKLAMGRFDYVIGAGTMNREHLRFFTRRTITDMFREAGYAEPTFHFPWRTFHLPGPERVAHALLLRSCPDLLYGSHTVSAIPA